MSGHSKWSTIKHKKAVTDAKKAGIFTKLGRLVAIAAKEGGGDPDMNFKLKMAIEQAKDSNVPNSNIERAIKKGTGKLKDGNEIEEAIYEAYGPGNVAMLIKTITDNKNRTVSELKNILGKTGGKLVSGGSVKFLFNLVGSISIPVENNDPYDLELKAIDAGVEDTICSGSEITVYTKPENLQKTKENLEKSDLETGDAVLAYIPIQKIVLNQDDNAGYERLIEALDGQEDVQEIYDNL